MKTKILRVARFLFKKKNYTLIHQEELDVIKSQRNNAYKLLLDLYAQNKDGLSGIVFSKDRALQLHALIHSYKLNIKNHCPLTVLYAASTREHEESYTQLINECNYSNLNISFIKQVDDFKLELLKIIESIKSNKIFFLVDDIIFINKFDLSLLDDINCNKYIISLRLNPDKKYSYTNKRYSIIPKFITHSGWQEFKWYESENEWADPWSLDGNIYCRNEIYAITKISNFSGPNSYENCLKSIGNFLLNKSGVCFATNIILNIPFNRVQSEFNNDSAEISIEELLNQWMHGKMIDVERYFGLMSDSCHHEVDIYYASRVKI